MLMNNFTYLKKNNKFLLKKFLDSEIKYLDKLIYFNSVNDSNDHLINYSKTLFVYGRDENLLLN
ncbi:MAG: hypothetical protein CMP65_00730 [Flavobacteriales bacterium]|nr:hypothetical protein [Flavobacteriales bacterium]